MQRLVFRFYAELNDFLSPERKQVEFTHWLKESAAIKDAIEALGVPHPEVDLILVNGESAGFDYLTQNGDRISVYPHLKMLAVEGTSRVRPAPLPEIKFVLDVHLGKLATYLRLLGFDALYRRDYDDAELAQISSQQQRILALLIQGMNRVLQALRTRLKFCKIIPLFSNARILLTQDRGLLKRSIVTHGYIVRSHAPEQQVREVLDRYHLHGAIAPFERCPRCNGKLIAVDKAEIGDRILPLTRLHYDEFSRCQSCDQIYWKGAHCDRIQQLIDRVTATGSGG